MSRNAIAWFFLLAGAALAAVGLGLVVGGQGPGRMAGSVFLMIGLIWVAVALLVGYIYQRMAARRAAELSLFETGDRGTAVIDSVETTGMVLNEVNQQVRLVLTVTPRYGENFQHERTMFVPFNGMPRPGQELDVAYDPRDISKVALAFDPDSQTGGGQLLLTRPPSAAPPATEPTEPAEPEASPTATLLDGLERLQQLREEGALTDAEFQSAKTRLLKGETAL